MKRNRVKICGLTAHIGDIDVLGADYLGFILWEPSKRNFTGSTLPATNAKKVGVFVDATLREIQNKIVDLQLNVVQLHGSENPEFARKVKSFGVEVFKAFQIVSTKDFETLNQYDVDAFVFDSPGKLPGGNGTQFNWDLLQQYTGATPFLLSGGLGLENLEAALQVMDGNEKCFGLDLNSALEIKPGVKDLNKVAAVIQKIQKTEGI